MLPQLRFPPLFTRKDASLDLLFLFYQEKRKSPLGGGEPRQAGALDKDLSATVEMTDFS